MLSFAALFAVRARRLICQAEQGPAARVIIAREGSHGRHQAPHKPMVVGYGSQSTTLENCDALQILRIQGGRFVEQPGLLPPAVFRHMCCLDYGLGGPRNMDGCSVQLWGIEPNDSGCCHNTATVCAPESPNVLARNSGGPWRCFCSPYRRPDCICKGIFRDDQGSPPTIQRRSADFGRRPLPSNVGGFAIAPKARAVMPRGPSALCPQRVGPSV